jgi:G3E family GTPase
MTVPLHIVTGFLGAGKTTVLDRLLRSAASGRTAVLINEAGAVSLDHHLVERVDGDVSVLASGCVCCTVQSELAEALERVLAHRPDRMVLETTGLAMPAPLVHAVTTHPRLGSALAVAGVVTVLDAQRAIALVDEQPEAKAQLELADRVVLTRLDVATVEQISALRERLARDYPAAEVLDAHFGDVPPERLLAPASTSRLADAEAASRWLGPAAPGHDVASVVIELGDAVDDVALGLWLRLVTQLDGPRLLRVKGIVRSRASGEWLLLQSAQHAVAPPRALEAEPRGWVGSRLVVLARGLDPRSLAALADAARSAADGRLRPS